jgi:hypothetical protein
MLCTLPDFDCNGAYVSIAHCVPNSPVLVTGEVQIWLVSPEDADHFVDINKQRI